MRLLLHLLSVAFCFAILIPVKGADSPLTLCFDRDNGIWIANADGTNPRKIGTGGDSAIAPDGAHVAYTESSKGSERRIGVVEIKTGAKIIFRSVPSDNAYGPIWSPDSDRIVFNIFVQNHWRFGLIEADGKGFRFIGEGSPTNSDYYSPVFAPDGASIYCQDLTNIYQLDLTGKILSQWKINSVVPGCDLDSGSRLQPSRDGRQILMDASLSDDGEIKSWEGPPPAVFLWDLTSGKSRRLTKGVPYGWAPCWLTATDYLFAGATDSRHFAIYKASLEGGTPQVLLKKATRITVGGR